MTPSVPDTSCSNSASARWAAGDASPGADQYPVPLSAADAPPRGAGDYRGRAAGHRLRRGCRAPGGHDRRDDTPDFSIRWLLADCSPIQAPAYLATARVGDFG